jgi:choline-glycine betaine transporter
MEREEALVFFAVMIFLIAALVVTVLKERNQERYDLKRSTEVLKDKVQNKSKPKRTYKKKRKSKVKKNETTN